MAGRCFYQKHEGFRLRCPTLGTAYVDSSVLNFKKTGICTYSHVQNFDKGRSSSFKVGHYSMNNIKPGLRALPQNISCSVDIGLTLLDYN